MQEGIEAFLGEERAAREDRWAVGSGEGNVLRTWEVGWEIRRGEDEWLQRCMVMVSIAVGLLLDR